MASLNQMAEALAERSGRQFSNPFQEEMKALIHINRSKLVRNTLERNRPDRIFFRQYFEAPMIVVNISELPGFPNLPVMRTECMIPSPLRANGIVFDYIGSPDKLSVFKVFTEQHEILPALNAEYTGTKLKALWLNNYVYVFGTLNLPYIGGASVFDDVREISNFKCNCGCDPCYDDDMEYPTPRDIQRDIIASILATELRSGIINSDKQVQVDAPEETKEPHRS